MNGSNNKIEEAIKFLSASMPDASKLVKPTLFHSIRVGVALHNFGYSEDIVIAGFLHDLVEDADVSIEEIEKSLVQEFQNL